MALITDGNQTKDFRVRDLPSLWDITLRQDWLVEGLIPNNSLIMLSGESGSGKSTVALLLADAISKGEPFLGRETKKMPVLIADRENGPQIYHERFLRLSIERNPDLLFWGHWCDMEPQGPDSKVIEEFVLEEKPLIIFDSFISFNDGDEQDASQTRTYMDAFRRLVGLGATVVLIHHTGKGENTKEYRGSSDIKASIDAGFVLKTKRPMLKLLSMTPFKMREGSVSTISLSLEDNRLVTVDSEFIPTNDKDWAAVLDFVSKNPKTNQSRIVQEFPEISVYKIRKILLVGESTGYFMVEKGPNNASLYLVGEKGSAHE